MGSVVLSIDAELGWGHHDLDDPPAARVEAGRYGWRVLLDMLDTYGIPATWGVVGHLFLDDCDMVHAGHPLADGWFDREHGAWRNRPDLRFAPDLIVEIEEAQVDHEIGCHTFSGVQFDRPETTSEVARAELVASLEAAADAPVSASMTSVLFPRNSVGHRDVLAEWGFSCYRGRGPHRPTPGGNALWKIGNATLASPPLVQPAVDEYGLVNVPASMYLFGFEGPVRRVWERLWEDPILAAAKRGIEAAVESDGIYHLWLHPNNLVTDADVSRVQSVLSIIAHYRVERDLRVETMAEIAARVTNEDASVPIP